MIRKARVNDVPVIQAVINHFADQEMMLHRSLAELYTNLRDYFVVEEGDQIVGCAALHLFGGDLAELKSIAVLEAVQRKGYGRLLVEACLQEARELGLPRVFALTFKPGFFEKLGFRLIERDALPGRIWTECLFCPKYPYCGEKPMMIEITGAGR